MQPIRGSGRHITMPAVASLSTCHLIDDLAVIFYKGNFLVAVDGRYYKPHAIKPGPVKVLRDLFESSSGAEARTAIMGMQRDRRLRPFRVPHTETLRGKAPAHVTGLPKDVFVTWFHQRVNLCTFEQIDEEGSMHCLIAYDGQTYALLPGDNPHYTDDDPTGETRARMARLLKDRLPTCHDPLNLQQLLSEG